MNYLDTEAYYDKNENFYLSINAKDELLIYEIKTVKEKCKSKKDVFIMFVFIGDSSVPDNPDIPSFNLGGTIFYLDKLKKREIDSINIPTGIFVIEESDCWEILAKIPKGKLKRFVREHIEYFNTNDDIIQTSMDLHEFLFKYLEDKCPKFTGEPPKEVGTGGILKPA